MIALIPFILLGLGLLLLSIVGVCAMVVWTIIRVITYPFRRRSRTIASRARILQPMINCVQVRCHMPNPAHARFCRRCGTTMQTRMVYRAA